MEVYWIHPICPSLYLSIPQPVSLSAHLNVDRVSGGCMKNVLAQWFYQLVHTHALTLLLLMNCHFDWTFSPLLAKIYANLLPMHWGLPSPSPMHVVYIFRNNQHCGHWTCFTLIISHCTEGEWWGITGFHFIISQVMNIGSMVILVQ